MLTLDSERNRIHWLKKITAEWVKYEPDNVANWINELPEGPERERAHNIYMADWVTRSPADFADWALDEGEPELREKYLLSAVQVWSANDNWNEGAAWLSARAPHPDLNSAVFTLAKMAFETDQAAGNEISGLISDPELYDRYLEERMTAEQSSVHKGVTKNLRRFASAAQQRMLDEGESRITLQQIVGDGLHIRVLNSVSGENYEGITVGTDTTRITVRTADGKNHTYDF